MEEKIKAEDFKEISIRARLAYGICCLENALVYYKKDISEWKELLDFLWEFPPITGFLTDWTEKILDYIPHIIIEYLYEKDFSISEDKYNYYKNLYSKTEKPILNLIDTIDYLGAEELYVGIEKYSPDTLEHVQRILDIMYEHKIPLPDTESFRQFKFDVKPIDDYGWGYPFDGKKLLSKFK